MQDKKDRWMKQSIGKHSISTNENMTKQNKRKAMKKIERDKRNNMKYKY